MSIDPVSFVQCRNAMYAYFPVIFKELSELVNTGSARADITLSA